MICGCGLRSNDTRHARAFHSDSITLYAFLFLPVRGKRNSLAPAIDSGPMTTPPVTAQLHPLLTRNLARMGYAQPRPIQAAAQQPILAGRDLIGLAATGTGKTAAFVAPILHQLLSARPGGEPKSRRDKRPVRPAERLRALVMCPTRELTQQVQKEAGVIAQGSVLRTTCAVGKSAIRPQADAIARGVDVLVATPGRAIELLEDGLLSLSHVRHVVIDEGDRMLDMGFLPQVELILQRIGEQRQVMLFSATMPPAMEDLARRFLRDPVRLEIGKHTTPVAHVRQHMIPVADQHKVDLLLHVLGAASASGSHARTPMRGVLIFCRTRRRVGWVGTALERHGIKVGVLHGDRSQAQRQKALEAFKDGDANVLVATDVAARGLHIPATRTVINYDLPMQAEEYVHRVGRAAHGVEDQVGEAFTLLDPEDRLKWRAIVNTTGIEVFAEHEVAGWKPPPPKRSKAAHRAEAAQRAVAIETDEPQRLRQGRFDPFNRPPRKRGRSHASKPIKKGQKPGGGVKRAS